MPVETTAASAAVLEIERFEWVGPERIEIVGYWSGLRGRRFMRPTLVLRGEGEPKRLLALLEHKPWSAADGAEWIAAFPWEGDLVKFGSAEMNVGSGIDLDLPAPRMRPGKPTRFRKRVVARDASRPLEVAAPKGVVSETPSAVDEGVVADPPPAAPHPSAAPESGGADAAAVVDPAVDRLRSDRNEMRRERDRALEKLRGVRAELESERQSRERAVNEARAAERESANRMLGEGAELRASVERQREIAYLERDDAKTARDEAIAARDKACEERDAALSDTKEARRERKEALAQRDRAIKLRERAEADRDNAIADREIAVEERDAAVKERDEIVRVHERGLPVAQPKPRFLPDDHEQRSEFDIWGPRASAVAVLLLCGLIVLKLIACG